MHLWTLRRWVLQSENFKRSGIRFRYERSVDPEVKDEPYIRLAAGDYAALTAQRGKDNALASVLSCLAHELTHYYQWINALSLTPVGRERQAARYARYILYEYSCTREHP